MISKERRFFYPFEVQVVDKDSHKINTKGEASHAEYKRIQIISSMKRVFSPLLKLKNITLE